MRLHTVTIIVRKNPKFIAPEMLSMMMQLFKLKLKESVNLTFDFDWIGNPNSTDVQTMVAGTRVPRIPFPTIFDDLLPSAIALTTVRSPPQPLPELSLAPPSTPSNSSTATSGR
ncbi:unnamed protein product [Lactuca saligna]|uniref:Uncharacterized protein n=1 Tax=Lactuca saligna TaxID=75948 RepID=A0AA35VFV0_LACSI|nr:unnamed protein product [Lactuca saligna]